MSGYGKHVTSDMNEHAYRKSSDIYPSLANYSTSLPQDDSYYGYVPIGFSESQFPMSSTSFEDTQHRAVHDSQSSVHSRPMYDAAQTDLTEYGTRKALLVESFSPMRGNPGTQVNIYLRADYDLLADPILVFTVLFGSHRVSASLNRLETMGPYHAFAASAIAPNMSEAALNNNTLQLRLQIQEQSGEDAGTVEIGYFEYISNVLGSTPPAQDGSRKRKLSETSMSPIQHFEDPSFAALVSGQTTQGLDPSPMPRRYAPHGRAQNKFRDITSRSGTQDLSIGSSARPFMRPPNSSASAFNPSYSFVDSPGRSVPTNGSSSAPLIRTSTLQQSPGASSAGSLGASSFNPYPLYGQKAVLKLKGNLNSMADHWTPEEWTAKRRLVQFFRTRDGCTVNARFAPVKPEDRQPNSITISCIWWEERQECFATSVDTIALLEQLVDNRFTVEEKNRIRRNLEGFKPLTVAKGKADSDEFFKVIMGFPNPKPRNIEKDVKVFEWKILAGALKKIISKYSASHASTAGPLSSAHSSIFTGYQSESTPDLTHAHPHMSSRSASISTASSYAQTLKSNMPSPNDTLPSQYSDAVTGKSLQTLTHNYISPSLPSATHFQPFADHHAIPPLPTSSSYPLSRSRSQHDISDYNIPSSAHSHPSKRPRANTSTASLHQTQHLKQATALAYAQHQHQHQVSRSFSEQPSSLPHQNLPSPHHHQHHHQQQQHHQHQHHRSGSFSQHLPSLSEEYASATSSGSPTPTQLHQPTPMRGAVPGVLASGEGFEY